MKNWTVDGDTVRAMKRHGREVRLPVKDAPLFLKLTKVKTFADVERAHRMLCPYDADLKVVPEVQLDPEVLGWFRGHAKRLHAHDGGDLRGYEAWFAYGREQGLYTFDPNERLLLVPCMAKGPMAPLEVTAGELGGRFLWASGYVVRAKNPADHQRVKALLEAPSTWRFLRRRGKQWTGGFRSFTPNQLRMVPEGVTVTPVVPLVNVVPATV
ncbi:hypothetical protein [Burkholderia sp. BE17]|uniref:hypothetical protein n=1 Tax=Burkholderia sp. BE17 TaxID=2656644 RepID=UPI001D12F978|nr:hypothetical protein [Burkholderia sp. BE17]